MIATVSPTKTTVASAVVAVVVLASLVSPIVTTYGLPSYESKAEHFLHIAQRAQEKFDELAALAETVDPDLLVDLADDRSDAEDLLGEAQDAFTSGEFVSSIERAKEAMKAFRQLYGELYTLLEEAGVDLETDNTGEGLAVAIQRAETRLERVEEILDHAEAAGMNVTEARALLEQAQALLEEASNLLEETQVEDAAHMLGDANSLIAHALASTKGAAGRYNVHRIRADSGLIKSLENQVARLEKQLDLAERKGLDVEDMRILLSDADSLIADAEGLPEDDIEEAIAKLVEAKEIIEAIDEELRTSRRGGPS